MGAIPEIKMNTPEYKKIKEKLDFIYNRQCEIVKQINRATKLLNEALEIIHNLEMSK